MPEQEDRVVKEYSIKVISASLAENCDVLVDFWDYNTNGAARLQQKVCDFTFPVGSSIKDEMIKLCEIWNSLAGRIINVRMITDNVLYYSKEGCLNIDDPDSIFKDATHDDFENDFEYSDSYFKFSDEFDIPIIGENIKVGEPIKKKRKKRTKKNKSENKSKKSE